MSDLNQDNVSQSHSPTSMYNVVESISRISSETPSQSLQPSPPPTQQQTTDSLSDSPYQTPFLSNLALPNNSLIIDNPPSSSDPLSHFLFRNDIAPPTFKMYDPRQDMEMQRSHDVEKLTNEVQDLKKQMEDIKQSLQDISTLIRSQPPPPPPPPSIVNTPSAILAVPPPAPEFTLPDLAPMITAAVNEALKPIVQTWGFTQSSSSLQNPPPSVLLNLIEQVIVPALTDTFKKVFNEFISQISLSTAASTNQLTQKLQQEVSAINQKISVPVQQSPLSEQKITQSYQLINQSMQSINHLSRQVQSLEQRAVTIDEKMASVYQGLGTINNSVSSTSAIQPRLEALEFALLCLPSETARAISAIPQLQTLLNNSSSSSSPDLEPSQPRNPSLDTPSPQVSETSSDDSSESDHPQPPPPPQPLPSDILKYLSSNNNNISQFLQMFNNTPPQRRESSSHRHRRHHSRRHSHSSDQNYEPSLSRTYTSKSHKYHH